MFPRPGDIMPGSYPFQILGLGDIAIPGLLAGLALRFDASRTVDMGSRAYAASTAIVETGKTCDPKAMTGDELANKIGKAAEVAYERIADAEDRRRAQGYGEEEVAPSTSGAEEGGLMGWVARVFQAKGDERELEGEGMEGGSKAAADGSAGAMEVPFIAPGKRNIPSVGVSG